MTNQINTDKFVSNLMESMYGKDSLGDIKIEPCGDNDEKVVKHSSAMGEDFGLPTNLGNAWNPGKMVSEAYGKNPMKEAHTEDHDEDEEATKGKKLTPKQKQLDKNKNQKLDAEDFKMLRKENQEMGDRISSLEESLSTLLESLQTLISEGYGGGKKMMKEDEKGNVSMNPGKKFIEKREKPSKEAKTVKVQGQDVDVKKATSNLADTPKGRERAKEMKMKAKAQQMDKEKPRKGGQALSKKEMAELTNDAKK